MSTTIFSSEPFRALETLLPAVVLLLLLYGVLRLLWWLGARAWKTISLHLRRVPVSFCCHCRHPLPVDPQRALLVDRQTYFEHRCPRCQKLTLVAVAH